ncbi:hypothetical protein E4T56_gene8386 [Termitomyces sp. T112]|nr:hypothetical protein C0989_001459 [Termitomyces sp. Mn162]KAG5732435.1 hypothetical protein E4T56_gene8386 [Termitomyces sp. T112]
MTAIPGLQEYDPTKLSSGEIFWRDHYNFLKDRGYTLRKRYDPDWIPSWINTSKQRLDCEDALPINHYRILDATRVDGSFVVLKRVDIETPQNEILMINHLSSQAFSSNPRNHCVPILDIINPPQGSHTAFIVMPLLFDVDFPPFETIGEAIGFFEQIFEGLHYMHENHIIHGDCKSDNIMADTAHLFHSPPHPWDNHMKRDFSGKVPKPNPRTLMPVKYHLIDFGLSEIYRPEDAPFLKQPPWGGDKTVPEHLLLDAPPCDPFAVDVYCLGNYLRQSFLDGWDELDCPPPQGFEFMRELITDMVNKNPAKRPKMSEVVSRFGAIVEKLGNVKLRSPVIAKDEQYGFLKAVAHWSKQLGRMARRIPAIPRI